MAAILVVVVFLSITKRDITEIAVAHAVPHAQVLIVANKTATSPSLLEAVRRRASTTPASFFLLVPNGAPHAEITDAERHQHHLEAERVLEAAIPRLKEAAGSAVDGAVSSRHDPFDAIEEALNEGEFHEVILSTLPHHLSQWLHADIPHRLAHRRIPVTTVTAEAEAANGSNVDADASAHAAQRRIDLGVRNSGFKLGKRGDSTETDARTSATTSTRRSGSRFQRAVSRCSDCWSCSAV